MTQRGKRLWFGAVAAVSLWAAASAARPQGSSTDLAAPLPVFTDTDLARALSDFKNRLSVAAPGASWNQDAAGAMSDVTHDIQARELTATQQAAVMASLQATAREHPDGSSAISAARWAITRLSVGKPAPEINGRDLDGAPLRLSDYRGKVVVLLFAGSWCGICRAEYPYERLLAELYGKWPFAMLGVSSDEEPAAARAADVDRGVPLRTWFDGSPEGDGNGRIAKAWRVSGWPTTYVIDGRGTIRFVNVRDGDLINAVRALLTEQAGAPLVEPPA